MGNSIKYQTSNLNLSVNQNLDFILHILAHLETNNVASNYDEGYVEEITQIKQETISSLKSKLEPLACGSYAYISFLPIFFPELDQVFNILSFIATKDRNYIDSLPNSILPLINYLDSNFEEKRKEELLTFVKVCRDEYLTFFADYWLSKKDSFEERMKLFLDVWDSEMNQLFINLFKSNNKHQYHIYLSDCMLKNGRGVSMDLQSIGSVSKLPENREEVMYSWMIAIHESIHQITDNIVMSVLNVNHEQRSLNQNDANFDIHMAFENAVFYTHFKLMSMNRSSSTTEVLKLFSDFSNQNIESVSQFHELFPNEDSVMEAIDIIIPD